MGDNNKGWKATSFDVGAVQERLNEIMQTGEGSPDVKRHILAAGSGPSCTGVGAKKPMELSIKFASKETERQKTLKKDRDYADTLNGFVDEKTGKMSAEKMAAAGLSKHAQDALRDAHNTATSITDAARGTGRLSEAGLKENHDRTLISFLKNNHEVMQYAAAAPKAEGSAPNHTAPTVTTTAALDL